MIPIIFSPFEVNLDSRMLDKILYVIGKGDMTLELLIVSVWQVCLYYSR